MACYPKTFLEHGVGDNNFSSTPNSVLYLPKTEINNLMTIWNERKPAFLRVLDTDGKQVLLYINNTPNNRLDIKGVLRQKITQEAIKNYRTNTIYTLGNYSNFSSHYYDNNTKIHVQSMLPYNYNSELYLKTLQDSYSSFQDYTPLAIFNNEKEYNNMLMLEEWGNNHYVRKNPQDYLNENIESKMGKQFSRTFDKQTNIPNIYWSKK